MDNIQREKRGQMYKCHGFHTASIGFSERRNEIKVEAQGAELTRGTWLDIYKNDININMSLGVTSQTYLGCREVIHFWKRTGDFRRKPLLGSLLIVPS